MSQRYLDCADSHGHSTWRNETIIVRRISVVHVTFVLEAEKKRYMPTIECIIVPRTYRANSKRNSPFRKRFGPLMGINCDRVK